MTPDGHRRLILTRHAKSDWDDPARVDHDRPLNTRGQLAAEELGAWLASRDYLPDEVFASDARRTAETWERLRRALSKPPEPQLLRNLYHAPPEAMLAVLKGATGRTVMMLGHNPGIAEFAARLAAEPPHHSDFARYPTAATLVIDFQIGDWTELGEHQGSVLDFFVPAARG